MGSRSSLRIRTRLRSVAYRIWLPKPKPVILMYHRIANDPVDNWRLSVSSAHFAQQLQVLRRTRYPLPLAEFTSRLLAGTLPQNAVALTFDDGYFDNLEAGKPLLSAADVPATVFLATGYLNRSGEIWSDELAKLILLGSCRQSFELKVRSRFIPVQLGTKSPARKDGTVRATTLKRRQAALTEIWEVLRHLDDNERSDIMAELRSKIEVINFRASPGRAMTSEEVLTLVKDGLVTIGAHTVTHPVLPALEPAACYREIKESKLACEALVGVPVQSFAYPYGRFDGKSRAAVETAGFTFACSTRHQPAFATSDIFVLPRIRVSNMDGDAFDMALRSVSAAKHLQHP